MDLVGGRLIDHVTGDGIFPDVDGPRGVILHHRAVGRFDRDRAPADRSRAAHENAAVIVLDEDVAVGVSHLPANVNRGGEASLLFARGLDGDVGSAAASGVGADVIEADDAVDRPCASRFGRNVAAVVVHASTVAADDGIPHHHVEGRPIRDGDLGFALRREGAVHRQAVRLHGDVAPCGSEGRRLHRRHLPIVVDDEILLPRRLPVVV